MKSATITSIKLIGLTIIVTVLISACSLQATPAPTLDVEIFYTQAAATIAIGLTQTSEAIPSQTVTVTSAKHQASATPSKNSSPTSLPTISPPTPLPAVPTLTTIPIDPATARGCNNASFVEDVTVKNAPAYKPGDHLTKTWRVKNTGSCDWPRGFKFIFVSGDRFGTENTYIDQKVRSGEMADLSLAMVAPRLNGQVSSNWQLGTEIGKPFGPILSVTITLPGTVTIPNNTSNCLDSELIADVSVPTGTQMDQESRFTKIWKIKNTGTCPWNRNFKFIFIGGDMFGAETTKIPQAIDPGATIEISLDMQAPASSGIISSAWQLASDTDQLFGQLFAFSITVK